MYVYGLDLPAELRLLKTSKFSNSISLYELFCVLRMYLYLRAYFTVYVVYVCMHVYDRVRASVSGLLCTVTVCPQASPSSWFV